MARMLFGISAVWLLALLFIVPANADEVHQWNFKPAENHEQPGTEPHYEKMLEQYGGVYIGDPDEKTIYLTFDNGYEKGHTEDVLDVLNKHDVPAAFFVTGHYLESAANIIQRMVEEGHIVGNHSWHHPSLPEVSDKRAARELGEVDEYYQDLTGEERMQYVRPPRGTFNEHSLELTASLGYTTVFWSFAYVDWLTDRQNGADYAYNRMMDRAHPGAVMLLHAVSEDNAKALDRVITDLKQEGYSFESLDHLMEQKAEVL
ncbi:peptidoglycan-N-acetylmuramic acid deacetylase [Salsuginibacillus halophilus]|uniref:Peptidoglycan-N-acetylmuramic acid deacetylase n=1 Tax=Salsuginibacillus halophilus TaxID=517424 RepID=A0A2P8HBK3_9BACI|nr:delta-lactam-biosynthetic de-N-acetylase [Salsuginibacillus halophilus]PSL43604.1 peptidoglycan-N-acetylmuramic acid deacetylase [Salsuginibacillus halophilus]